MDEYKLKNGKRIYVLGAGPAGEPGVAEGHPPSVMDMSFATQALATEYCVKNKGKLSAAVHNVPVEVEEYVARHKLASMGIKLDKLTAEQTEVHERLGTGDVRADCRLRIWPKRLEYELTEMARSALAGRAVSVRGSLIWRCGKSSSFRPS